MGLSVTLASRLQKEGTARVLCRVLLLLEQAEAEKKFKKTQTSFFKFLIRWQDKKKQITRHKGNREDKGNKKNREKWEQGSKVNSGNKITRQRGEQGNTGRKGKRGKGKQGDQGEQGKQRK